MSDDNYPQTSIGNDVYLATRKKTQKKKVMRTNDDKSKLWSIYDNDKLSASVEGSQNEINRHLNVFMLKTQKRVIYVNPP